jgi:hypothetical protein
MLSFLHSAFGFKSEFGALLNAEASSLEKKYSMDGVLQEECGPTPTTPFKNCRACEIAASSESRKQNGSNCLKIDTFPATDSQNKIL